MSKFRILLQVLSSLVLLGALLCGASGRASAASIIYVKPVASGLHNGTSWANAYGGLQVALAHAVSGDQVWVAKGTYKPGNARTATFTMVPGVAIYGGFAGSETLLGQRNWKINSTILSGEIGTSALSDNIYHVVTCGGVVNTGILDGFTIQSGVANGLSPNNTGGAIYCNTSSPTLGNLIIKNNAALDAGGGIYNYNGNPKLVNVTVSGNKATGVTGAGGGMHSDSGSPVLRNVIFSGNSAEYGGAFYTTVGSPDLKNVKFINNKAGNGAAMFSSGSNPVVARSTFSGNSTTGDGGAVVNTSSGIATFSRVVFTGNSVVTVGKNAGAIWNSGSLTLNDVTLSGNKAPGYAGAIYNVGQITVTGVSFVKNSAANGGAIANFGGTGWLSNVTFSGNTAPANGAAMFNASSTLTLTNTTFRGNFTPGHGGAMYNMDTAPTIYDSILWGDGPVEVYTYSGSGPAVTNGIFNGGCPAGGSCLNVIRKDPRLGPLQNNGGFTQTMALLAGSPAIDRGNVANCATLDQRGIARPQGVSCDLGAYEVKAIAFPSQAVYDGQVMESAAGSNQGGTTNSTFSTLFVGDYPTGQRLRGFLSFDTSPLADGASLVAAKLQAEQLAPPTGNPFATLGKLVADEARPFFGAGAGLVPSDWQASATVSPAGTFGSVPSGNWYTAPLNSSAVSNINKLGITQFRLRFTLTDNNSQADYIIFNSADTANAADRPVLFVYYNP